MQRCLELASLGAGAVAPNPMVGAVLVHQGRIIGEGYHRRYGEAHAEVNCIASVKEADRSLIASSTLYVSLEPCAHFGKTPPCADLVIKQGISSCKIGCRDPFAAVNGKGIEKLVAAGVQVEIGLLEKKCQEINRRFFTYHLQKRPYVILKWAQTADRFIGLSERSDRNDDSNTNVESSFSNRLLISNQYTNRLVHKWRSEEAAIMIGTNTALLDNPVLTNRHWFGGSPARVVLDMHLRLPHSLHLFGDGGRTIVFNSLRSGKQGNCHYYQLNKEQGFLPQVAGALYEMGIQSVLVEGGAKLLQSFIDLNAWDEARVITNTKSILSPNEMENGCPAPVLRNFTSDSVYQLSDDQIQLFKPATR